MVKNPPSNAGEAGSIPGQGTKIPHAVGQLSPCATTTKLARLSQRAPRLKLQSPLALEPVRHNKREKTHMPQLERSPCAATMIPHATTKTRRSQKNKLKNPPKNTKV